MRTITTVLLLIAKVLGYTGDICIFYIPNNNGGNNGNEKGRGSTSIV